MNQNKHTKIERIEDLNCYRETENIQAGWTYDIGGLFLNAKEGRDCSGCYFDENNISCYGYNFDCCDCILEQELKCPTP